MKLMIDIDEELYEAYKGNPPVLGDAGMDMIAQAIANGIPYNPSGDAISREALKDITYINKGNFNTVEGIREWIDNAQAVEHSLLPLSSEADNAYMRGYEVGKAEGILKASTRPKGDLISREALRKAFENLASDDYNEPIWYQQTVFETIDNAQTIPQVTVFAENADENAIEDMKAELQSVIEARPQGEYISVDKLFAKCSICGNLTRVLKKYNMPNFCPACGADMRPKGGAE